MRLQRVEKLGRAADHRGFAGHAQSDQFAGREGGVRLQGERAHQGAGRHQVIELAKRVLQGLDPPGEPPRGRLWDPLTLKSSSAKRIWFTFSYPMGLSTMAINSIAAVCCCEVISFKLINYMPVKDCSRCWNGCVRKRSAIGFRRICRSDTPSPPIIFASCHIIK